MNDEIKATELRVIYSNAGQDEPLGILSRTDALSKAKELGGLDLIVINDKSDPPVCKIVDYSKYRYQQEKKAKELKKNSKATEIKEVKMSYKIDVHDYEVRKKNASKFLKQGNRVKCTIMFRGREVQHDNLGYDLLDKLAQDLDEMCLSEGRPKREGRNLSRILAPRPEVMKAVTDGRKAEDKAKKLKKQEQKKEALQGKVAKTGEVAIAMEIDDDEDDDDDDFDDDEDDSSLDELLSKDEFTDSLFS